MKFSLVNPIYGVSKSSLSAEIINDQIVITRTTEQNSSGSAYMKLAGQVLAIHLAYPKAKIVFNLRWTSGITPGQRKIIDSQVSYLNKTGINVEVIHRAN